MPNKYYITTTLPYVNAPPHIGFALEIIQADVLARYHDLVGEEVFFNTGTDEHGLKIYRKAQEKGLNPQEYVDQHAEKFRKLKDVFNLFGGLNFIRTTDSHHIAAAQEFWRRCAANGDIYKKFYQGKYCVGCELEKTDSELVDGKCPIHPNLEIEIREEENYFFRFSKYGEKLLELYSKNAEFVLPPFRFNEIKKFVESGLRDFSISRLKEKMPWGVDVPDDPAQVMYVWFDALVNYISALGWPEDEATFTAFWGTHDAPNAIQCAGTDNLRPQSATWQAMLFSAGLPNSKQILIHGFLMADGKKMSKSLGNVIDPYEVVKKYGVDAVRYYLLREIPSGEDGDFSEEKLRARYEGDLANGLGNFVARVLTLAERDANLRIHTNDANNLDPEFDQKILETKSLVLEKIDTFKLHEALAAIWELIAFGDFYVNDKKVWAIENEEEKSAALYNLVVLIDNIGALIAPFLPGTSEKIKNSIRWEGDTLTVKKGEVLFPRLG